MYKLNLPEFEVKLKKEEGRIWIFDHVRRKYLVLTPEEWVRQHFVNYLLNHLQYPKSLLKVESGLSYNQLAKRSDVVVFDREAKPWMLVECKSPYIEVNEDTLRQAATYNHTLQAKFIVVTNGMKHFCSEIDWINNATHPLTDLPTYPS